MKRTSYRTHAATVAWLIGGLALAPASLGQSQKAQSDNKKDLTDSRVTMAIEDEMHDAKQVSANRIDVTVRDGVATLTGEAANLLEKRRAVRIARGVMGVRGVDDRITVKKSDRGSDEIRTDVARALASDPATDSWEIQVSVNDGNVTLAGEVQSYAERQLASTVTMGVKGVRSVDNQITVDYQHERADYEIQQDIAQRLRWDSRIDDGLIAVTVAGGDVTLTGSVGSAYEHALAVSDAWVAGVDSVDAEGLEVEWWARDRMNRSDDAATGSDAQIRDAVVRAFVRDPRVYSFRPAVEVEDGTVTLTGTVDDLKAKRAAAQLASETEGVRRVKNFLKVRPARDMQSATIEQNVRAAMARDPVIDRYEVLVDVVNGTAHLYGEVDSYYARAQAEDVAARTVGVTEVENYLSVGYDVFPNVSYYDWDPIDYDFDYDYQTVTTRPDYEIQDEIESELFWSPFVDSDAVTVTVLDGVATLTGTVDSWSERDAAAENAIEGGAVRVINRLDVAMR